MPLRIYTDTSVIGGCLDQEFAEDSTRFFQAAVKGHVVLLVSEIVLRELEDAPPSVRALLTSLPRTAVERVEITKEVLELRDAYIKAKILTPRSANEAAHVAAATIARADAIVSWNFRHIVRLDKMKAYNQVIFCTVTES